MQMYKDFFKEFAKLFGIFLAVFLLFAWLIQVSTVWQSFSNLFLVYSNFQSSRSSLTQLSLEEKRQGAQFFEQNLLPVVEQEKIALFVNNPECQILGIWSEKEADLLKVYQSRNHCERSNPYEEVFKKIKPLPFDQDSQVIFKKIEKVSTFEYKSGEKTNNLIIGNLDFVWASYSEPEDKLKLRKNLGSFSFYLNNSSNYIGHFRRFSSPPQNDASNEFLPIWGQWYQSFSRR